MSPSNLLANEIDVFQINQKKVCIGEKGIRRTGSKCVIKGIETRF